MGVPTMAQARTFVALDVHVSGTVAAIIDGVSGELRRRWLSGGAVEVAEFVAGLPGPVRATYEAGPTGFALARRLDAAGVSCLVCAPGLIPRGSSDRVKTDRRDAERLARLLIAGELHAVAVPSIEAEGLRDLVRAREDLRGDLMSARHRVQVAVASRRSLRGHRAQTGPGRICGGWRACASPSRERRRPSMTIAARSRR
jgi:transposase